MRFHLLLALPLLLISACVTSPVPRGYSGPVAMIQESFERVDAGKAKAFYVSKLDGQYIINSEHKSRVRSSGMGNQLSIVAEPYEIPAGKHLFTIMGSHTWAMDGRGIIESALSVEGDIEFIAEEGVTYLVGGSLSKEVSTVWVKRQGSEDVIAGFEKLDP